MTLGRRAECSPAKGPKDRKQVDHMNEENQKKLREHPVFAKLSRFSCRDGWFNILDSLGAMARHRGPDFLLRDLPTALQVKEKFGGLRIYLSSVDPYFDGLVAMAETLSTRTCEVCGNVGESCTVNGWRQTLCEEHRLPELEYLATRGSGGMLTGELTELTERTERSTSR